MRPKQSTKRPKGSVRPNPSTLTSLIYPRRRSCPLFIAIHRRRRSRVHSPFIHVAILVSIAVLVPCLSILFFYAAVLVPHSCRQTFPFSLLILFLQTNIPSLRCHCPSFCSLIMLTVFLLSSCYCFLVIYTHCFRCSLPCSFPSLAILSLISWYVGIVIFATRHF